MRCSFGDSTFALILHIHTYIYINLPKDQLASWKALWSLKFPQEKKPKLRIGPLIFRPNVSLTYIKLTITAVLFCLLMYYIFHNTLFCIGVCNWFRIFIYYFLESEREKKKAGDNSWFFQHKMADIHFIIYISIRQYLKLLHSNSEFRCAAAVPVYDDGLSFIILWLDHKVNGFKWWPAGDTQDLWFWLG